VVTADANRERTARSESPEGLTDFEREVYGFIRERGEVLTSEIPPRMMGAVPNLKNRGLVEVYRRPTTRWASKKRTFIRATEKQGDAEEAKSPT